jgi:hypothetical protein
MRMLKRLSIPMLAAAALGLLAAAAAATAPKLQDLPVTFAACPQAPSVRLQAGVTYQASKFPRALRLTPPDGTWSGGQRKSGSTNCDTTYGLGHGPFYGWVAVGQGPSAGPPRGSIVIMTSYSQNPSVPAAVNLLRAGEAGSTGEITYEPISRAKVAGVWSTQFDGKVVGSSHWFFAFSSPHAAKGSHSDGVQLTQGTVFRVVVLGVRGKTVVVYITNGSLPPKQFPAFLTKANRMLRTLAFPKGA